MDPSVGLVLGPVAGPSPRRATHAGVAEDPDSGKDYEQEDTKGRTSLKQSCPASGGSGTLQPFCGRNDMSDPAQFENFVLAYQDMVFSTAVRLLGNDTGRCPPPNSKKLDDRQVAAGGSRWQVLAFPRMGQQCGRHRIGLHQGTPSFDPADSQGIPQVDASELFKWPATGDLHEYEWGSEGREFKSHRPDHLLLQWVV